MSESPTTVTAIEEPTEDEQTRHEFRLSGMEQHQTYVAMSHSRRVFEAGGPLQFLAPLPSAGTGIFVEKSYEKGEPHSIFICFPPYEKVDKEPFIHFFECMSTIRDLQIQELSQRAESNLEIPVGLELHDFAKQFMARIAELPRPDMFHIETTGVENKIPYKAVFLGKDEIIMYECNKQLCEATDVLLINKYVDTETPCRNYYCTSVRKFDIPTELNLA